MWLWLCKSAYNSYQYYAIANSVRYAIKNKKKIAQIENFYLKILEEFVTAVLGYPQIRLLFEHEYRSGDITLRANSKETVLDGWCELNLKEQIRRNVWKEIISGWMIGSSGRTGTRVLLRADSTAGANREARYNLQKIQIFKTRNPFWLAFLHFLLTRRAAWKTASMLLCYRRQPFTRMLISDLCNDQQCCTMSVLFSVVKLQIRITLIWIRLIILLRIRVLLFFKSDANLRSITGLQTFQGSILSLHASIVSIICPPWLHFEPL